MLIDFPRRLPKREDLLVQPRTKIYQPDPKVLNLTAWSLLKENLKKKAFQKKLENCYHKEKELKSTVSCKFSSLCDKRNKYPYSECFVDCAEFLRELFKDVLQYRIGQCFHLFFLLLITFL